MALTNFSLLTDEQKTVWSMDLWEQARNQSFINKFIGDDDNSIIQRVGELTKTAKGNRAVRNIPSTSLAYPFQVLRDENPRGRDWLRQILAQ